MLGGGGTDECGFGEVELADYELYLGLCKVVGSVVYYARRGGCLCRLWRRNVNDVVVKIGRLIAGSEIWDW